MSWKILAAAAVFASVAPGSANAAWYRASTPHFIIYSEQRPDDLRAYAERLERFDQAVRQVRGMDDPAVGDGNRLTLYVVPDVGAVQRLHGRRDSGVYGFYIGRYTGPVAFTPRRTDGFGAASIQAENVFFHEYAHHLMFQKFDQAYPNWIVEGFAELLSTPVFGQDGSVMLGTSPTHRAYGLFRDIGLSTSEILTSQPQRLNREQRESIYGRGWLLTHYLTFEPGRAGQIDRYVANLSRGQPTATAAANAFGDLKQLDREIGAYVLRRKLKAVTVAGNMLKVGRIDIAPVTQGEAEAMPWRMMSKRGVNAKTAPTVVARLRPIGARYPTDAIVQASVAEAEQDSGNFQAALVAADAAIKADPRLIEAHIHRGRALLSLAEKKDPAGNYDKARDAFMAANKLDSEDPEPLYLFFRSFLAQGRAPNANALAALHYASALAPQDDGLRSSSAIAWLNEGKLPQARIDLLPIAYNPHGGEEAVRAKTAIERIDAGDGKAARAALAAGQAKPATADFSRPKSSSE